MCNKTGNKPANLTFYLSPYTSEYQKLVLWGNMFPRITRYGYNEDYDGGDPVLYPSWSYNATTGILTFGNMPGDSEHYYSTLSFDIYVRPGVITGY